MSDDTDTAECGVSYEHTNPVSLGDGTWECKDCGAEYYDGDNGDEEH